MLACEFCDKADEQAKKSHVTEYGKAATTTLRLVAPWVGAGRRIIIADAWFDSLRTGVALKRHGFICNVKGSTTGSCKKELFAAAKSAGNRELQRNDKAFM